MSGIPSISESANGHDFKKSRRPKTLQERGSATLDRLPPHSLEMEMGVLGCIMLSPNECLNTCILEFGSASHEHFYDLRHQEIYKTLKAMFEKMSPIDLITIQQDLKERDMLEQIGGIPYLSQIQNETPSAANLSWYMEKVKEKFTLRRMIQVCTGVVGRIYEYQGDVEQLLGQVEHEILSVRPVRQNFKTIKALLNEAIPIIEARARNWDLVTGLSYGLSDLDAKTDGMHEGEFIVIGAPTSCGKTAMALGVAMHNALAGVPAAFVSAEMLPVRLAIRALCSESRVNFKQISERDVMNILTNIGKISSCPIYIESVNGFTIGQVRALARRLKQQYGIKIFAVENIQLLHGEGDNREQRIANISSGLKGIALELGISVLGLSQLNEDNRLRESRAIAHDADTVLILQNEGEWVPTEQPMVLAVEKCRDGETGIVPLTLFKTFTRFEQPSKVKDEDVPTNPHND